MKCPACGSEILPGATFCALCRERGRPVARVVVPGISADNDPRERFFLIVACLLSAGALAVPRLRRSRAFGPVGKVVLGTLAVLQTTLCVVIVLALIVKGPWLVTKWMQFLEQRTSRKF
jgi:hypothetical protein